MVRLARQTLILSLLALPVLGAEAQSDSASRLPEVRTSATAERSVRPDLAIVTFSFNATGPTPLAAGRAVAARADSLRRALQALGIPRDSLVSGSRWYWWRGRVEMVVSPVRYVPAPRDSITGLRQRPVQDTSFRAFDAIEVRLRDLTRVGAAIDTALAHDVRDISPIRFQATDVSAVHEAALREATQRARRRAAAIAEASGGRLGRTLSLSTESDGGYNRFGFLSEVTVNSAGAAGNGAGTEVIQPSIPVRMTVYGRWELLGQP